MLDAPWSPAAAETAPPCRTCRHARRHWPLLVNSFGTDRRGSWEHATCGHPSAAYRRDKERRVSSLVAGAPPGGPEVERLPCSWNRGGGVVGEGRCGEAGRFWEPVPSGPRARWREAGPFLRAAAPWLVLAAGTAAIGTAAGVVLLLEAAGRL
ncbi:hypothetical protein GCM10009416_13200 [Craurococcus roseus]|uniref:Uncharacterized protein n=1 Tax=Craurococcus roseus TaxID=77585 RepID=A0ABP3PZ27_9PROT